MIRAFKPKSYAVSVFKCIHFRRVIAVHQLPSPKPFICLYSTSLCNIWKNKHTLHVITCTFQDLVMFDQTQGIIHKTITNRQEGFFMQYLNLSVFFAVNQWDFHECISHRFTSGVHGSWAFP